MRYLMRMALCVGLSFSAHTVFASCDTTIDMIAGKIHENGVPYNQFSLHAIPAAQAENAEGTIVGRCGNNRLRILYTRHAPKAQAEHGPESESAIEAQKEDASRPDAHSSNAPATTEPSASAPDDTSESSARQHGTYKAAPSEDAGQRSDDLTRHKNTASTSSVPKDKDIFEDGKDGTPWYLK
ncbi:DUF1161 domain-containing protein [Larsenimonas salina]|uniref:DUF1161 domain-containing protein n=1 Tax=Larsenimonas salina TaxID=1295565 RepID=UPI002073593E|nr:DUF1161 domain-containing protein [Larsenimonas salina]MCM5703451.1 DUF1161 domain-containing protein [Larsenimonas salina]